MDAPVLLVTPPFTQLNTPYPATAYLKGFFNIKHIKSEQADLGIEVTLQIFCKKGLIHLFEAIESEYGDTLNANSTRIVALKERYINTIDSVILFLQGKQPTLAHLISTRQFYLKQVLLSKWMICIMLLAAWANKIRPSILRPCT